MAAARMCSTVLVEPPMAMSSVMAFSNALVATLRGSTLSSFLLVVARARSTIRWPASTNRRLRSAWVASVEPLPGSERPSASVRQFIELAVNMPEQEPQVGQAERSMTLTSSSVLVVGRGDHGVDQVERLQLALSMTLPASIGPPETKTVGMLRRIAAISMPGVILSQLEMQTMASAQWALTMYSTLSAISSRDGSE
jgi:hypothetical protein